MTDERFFELCKFENQYCAEGFRILGGVDEAGRGPLAGPVVAACVILPSDGPFPRADDSKKLSAAKRDNLFDVICDMAISYGVGIIDNNIIDEINILEATHLAMKTAIENCQVKPDVLFVDHLHIKKILIKQVSITHGDALSVSIGAASIIAKVTRDRIMEQFAIEYPGYNFEKHKGYGTKSHYEAINQYGLTPIHRRTFCKGLF